MYVYVMNAWEFYYIEIDMFCFETHIMLTRLNLNSERRILLSCFQHLTKILLIECLPK